MNSLGEQITASPHYPRRPVSDLIDYQFWIPFDGGIDVLRKSITGASVLVPPDIQPFRPPIPRIEVLDVLPRTPTQSNTVLFVQQTMFTNAAAGVGAGAVKPESTLAYQQATANVQVIATWIPVTNKMLDDATVLEAIIDSTLTSGLNQELSRQILVGTGTAELLGILNTAGINMHASGGGTMHGAIRHGVTLVIQNAQIIPDAIILHPQDAETLDMEGQGGNYMNLEQAGTYGALEGYTGAISTRSQVSVFSGIRFVQSLAMPQGTALVGNFALGCMLFDRQVGRVMRGLMNDDFVRNIQVLRAELEAAFAVLRPAAFTQVTGL